MTSISAPRITPEDIEAAIVAEHYFTARDGAEAYDQRHNQGQTPYHISLGLLTFCVLVLRNGFTVTGESACVSPVNFNAEIGRKWARDKAIEKMWPLLGYELKSKVTEAEHKQAEAERQAQAGTGD